VPGPHRTRVSNKGSRANRERCVARRASDGLDGPRWGRNSAEPGGQQGTEGDNERRGQQRFRSHSLGQRNPWTALSHGRGHRFETCHAHTKPRVRPGITPGLLHTRWGPLWVRIASQRLRLRRRRPHGCFDGIRRPSILADQHTPRVLSTGTATYTTTASPRTPRRTQAISPGELPRVYQAHTPGTINSAALATLAAGGAGSFIGHHLAAASAERQPARGSPGEPSIPPGAHGPGYAPGMLAAMTQGRQTRYFRSVLVCGVCGRVLDRLFLGGSDHPVAISRWGVSPVPTGPGTAGAMPPSKPSVQRHGLHWFREHHPAEQGKRGRAGRIRYVCHPRCGADYSLRLERLTAAMQAGKTCIVAGVDV
jgi:hypothetical protein